MTKTRRHCKVCGKEFIACLTAPKTNVFRWQDYTCSPACGAKYLEMKNAEKEAENK